MFRCNPAGAALQAVYPPNSLKGVAIVFVCEKFKVGQNFIRRPNKNLLYLAFFQFRRVVCFVCHFFYFFKPIHVFRSAYWRRWRFTAVQTGEKLASLHCRFREPTPPLMPNALLCDVMCIFSFAFYC
jgi:hypothetical protein